MSVYKKTQTALNFNNPSKFEQTGFLEKYVYQ